MLLKSYVDIWVYRKNFGFYFYFYRLAKTQVETENGWLKEKKIVNKKWTSEVL